MTFKVLAFLHIFMMIGFGILQKAEAKDIPVCCCDKDPNICRSLCGFIDVYFCDGFYCECGHSKPPQSRIAQTNETTN
ncbi:hypothetical protein H5410_053306 [Solanum commersonii]|uniref:Uncharacterized protein n=1 Tax=Solanum commersonii TaxID=4109 RepID=A0A9J5X4J2_SOLCO|nr:hypothetical protein H5410_053306 [Solanum commersonii]